MNGPLVDAVKHRHVVFKYIESEAARGRMFHHPRAPRCSWLGDGVAASCDFEEQPMFGILGQKVEGKMCALKRGLHCWPRFEFFGAL